MQEKVRPAIIAVAVALMVLAISQFAVERAIAQGPAPRAPRANIGTAFTYQGQLKDNGAVANGAFDFQFALYDSSFGGTQIGATINSNDVNVSNGYFVVSLDFGADIFNGEARHLEIRVRPGASNGAYTTLTPRQALTPAPYALALPGFRTQQKNSETPNILGGNHRNVISSTVQGGTISGGGFSSSGINQVWGNFGTVGGGADNIASGVGSVVAGGGIRSAGAVAFNLLGNTAAGEASVVGGGIDNTASGDYATVPGGSSNSATMDYAFAAGRNANANHQGAFVWGDSAGSSTTSSKDNQFVIRATNGVSLAVNAGSSKVIDLGERYRDNAIVAWGVILAGGTLTRDFGVDAVAKSTGIYTMTLTTQAQDTTSLVPIAIAEVNSAPTSAASARLISVRQVSTTQFVVYITNGSYTLVDNDFVFIVTGR